ncbi:MAG: hypothetical protein HKN93_05000 [Acidimicrobiia bacterium]|nr:hypothetical protein [Acidimicrobiia bacterium]
MNVYEKTQIAPPVIPVIVGLMLVLVAGVGIISGEWPALVVAVVMAVILVPIAIVFSRLTVTVDDSVAKAAFGFGWPRTSVTLGDVGSARIVRNKWWYGFGIRWYPGGILWNVWGLDAVEFEMREGRNVRLGTDDADQLIASLAGRVTIA